MENCTFTLGEKYERREREEKSIAWFAKRVKNFIYDDARLITLVIIRLDMLLLANVNSTTIYTCTFILYTIIYHRAVL